MDPASMLYLWDESAQKAIPVNKGKKGTPIYGMSSSEQKAAMIIGKGVLGVSKILDGRIGGE